MPIRAVIFDMDGVISLTIQAHLAAQKKALAEIEIHESLEVLRRMTGIPTRTMFEELIRRYGIVADINALHERKNQLVMEELRAQVHPVPGAVELIRLLHANGLRLAVGSSSVREVIDLILGALNVSNYFEAVSSASDVARGKPFPDIFLLAAEKMGVPPSECVVIEDSMYGVQAARAAGMKCIAFDHAENDGHDFSQAERTVNHLSDITLTLIRQLGEN